MGTEVYGPCPISRSEFLSMFQRLTQVEDKLDGVISRLDAGDRNVEKKRTYLNWLITTLLVPIGWGVTWAIRNIHVSFSKGGS